MRRCTLLVCVSLLLSTAPGHATTIKVDPGQSIQAAIDAAAPGDTIEIAGNTSYQEPGRPCPSDPTKTCGLVVTKDGLKLVSPTCGRRAQPCAFVAFLNPGGQDRAIEVARSGAAPASCASDPSQRVTGFTLQGFAISGFDEVGISLLCVDKFLVKRTTAHVNGENGIVLSHSSHGRFDGVGAGGNGHSGIYVRESSQLRFQHILNTAGNICGLEVENSSGVACRFCSIAQNSVGVLFAAVPFLDVKTTERNSLTSSLISANDKPDTCTDPSDPLCAVPTGTGVMILGADRTTVARSRVVDNPSLGIRLANYCGTVGLGPAECGALDVDPDPDFNRIQSNTATGNASAPDSAAGAFAADLSWDGTGVGNCWKNNQAGSQSPPDLPCD
jgi:hypothetical protein